MISDLISDRKILFYVTYFSHKFISSCITNLLISKCHLTDDVFPYVVLTWPWFRAFCIFSFCASLRDVHQGALTSEGAGLIWVNYCQQSTHCGGRDHGLVHQEVGDGVFALIIQADVIGPGLRVGIPRPCRGVRMGSQGTLSSLLLSLNPFCLNQGMDLVVEFIWVDEINLWNFYKLHKFLFYGISQYLDQEPAVGSCVELHLNDALVESKNKFLIWFAQFLPQASKFLFSLSPYVSWLEHCWEVPFEFLKTISLKVMEVHKHVCELLSQSTLHWWQCNHYLLHIVGCLLVASKVKGQLSPPAEKFFLVAIKAR